MKNLVDLLTEEMYTTLEPSTLPVFHLCDRFTTLCFACPFLCFILWTTPPRYPFDFNIASGSCVCKQTTTNCQIEGELDQGSIDFTSGIFKNKTVQHATRLELMYVVEFCSQNG